MELTMEWHPLGLIDESSFEGCVMSLDNGSVRFAPHVGRVESCGETRSEEAAYMLIDGHDGPHLACHRNDLLYFGAPLVVV